MATSTYLELLGGKISERIACTNIQTEDGTISESGAQGRPVLRRLPEEGCESIERHERSAGIHGRHAESESNCGGNVGFKEANKETRQENRQAGGAVEMEHNWCQQF